MMAVIEFVSGPVCQRVGWTLLHFVWQGAAVAALASLAVGVLRLGHARARYAAYLVALAGMAACPLVTFFALPAPGGAAEEAIAEPPARHVVYGAAVSIAESTETGAIGQVTAARAQAEDEPPAGPGWRELVVARLDLALPWIVGGWLVGVFVLSVRLALGVAGSWRWRRDLVPLPESLGERVAALSSRLGLARTVRVFVSRRAVQAIAVGWLEPMVLVPASQLLQMPPEVLEGVIAHELAHIIRRDLWVNLFQRVVETLLFYHPAIWWLSGRLRYERELCCDELAVRATGRQAAYAQALEWAGRAAAPAGRVSLVAGFARGRKALLGRVRHVLGLASAGEHAHEGRAGLAGVAAVVLALVALGASQVLAGGSKDQSESELLPRWPQFKAKKVSFKDAGLEPLSTQELIKRLTAAQGIMKHSIVKTKTHTTWWNDYRNSTRVSSRGPMRDFTGKMEDHEEMEIRLDGQRCAVRERRWGNAGVPLRERESFKPEVLYFSYLWDGTRYYDYSCSESEPPGKVWIREGETFSETNISDMSHLAVDATMRGLYESMPIEFVLPGARSVKPRDQLEEISGSPCYVLDADTVDGKYVLWIDPAHGYHIARAEETKREGDLYGALRLPWWGAQRKTTVENSRFREVNGVWVPMECEVRKEEKSSDGPCKTLMRHERTAVALNPNFDALGSFVPDDVKEGARVEMHTAPNGPFGDKADSGFWKNGGFVPSTETIEAKRWSRVKKVGDVAPDFTVKTLDGKQFRLGDHRGKVVLLHFWHGSGTSTAGLPGLKDWYDSMADYRDHFAMISLNMEPLDFPIPPAIKEYGLTWPQAQARDGNEPLATTNHGVLGIPAFIFVGPDGRIIPSDETSVMTILKGLKARGARRAPSPGSAAPVPVYRGQPRKGTEEKGAEPEAKAQPRPKVKVGDLAPDFTVKTLDGKQFRLSDYRDKVVLLYFWATWSKPCVADASRLKGEYDAMEEYRKHFVMISLSLDDQETPVRRHVKEHGLTWPHACVGRKSQIAADYGVTGVPEFIFIGPDGKIIPSDETSVKTILKALQTRGARPTPSLGSPGPADSGGPRKGKGKDTE